MLLSGVILTVTFVGIFTGAVHGFHRTKFATGGAGAIILTLIVSSAIFSMFVDVYAVPLPSYSQ